MQRVNLLVIVEKVIHFSILQLNTSLKRVQ